MVSSINSLANMEYMLYGAGGYGTNTAAPSIYNNYRGGLVDSTAYSPYGYYPSFYGYNNTGEYNSVFGQNVPTQYAQTAASTQQSTSANTGFSGLTEKETKALVDTYVKAPSESLLGAAWGGVTFGLMNNPRFVAHPINTFKAFKGVDPMFKSVLTEGSKLNQLWTNPETNSIVREAYCEMQRAFARGESRLAIFRKKFSTEEVSSLKGIMEKALKTGNAEEIAKATEILKSAYVTDTWLGRRFKWLLKIGGFDTPYTTATEAIEASKTIEGAKTIATKANEVVAKAGKTSFKQALVSHAGIGGILFFAGIEFLTGMGNIKKSFEKDKENKQKGIKTNYGWKQLGQTAIKGVGSVAGWGVGEAVSTWAFAKWGAKLGSKFHPVIGTIIGGVIGLVGGSVGMAITGKLTNKLVGTDIGETLTAQDLTKTPEGQVELLQNVYEKVQKGQASPEAAEALRKALIQLQTQQVPQSTMAYTA